MRPPILEIVAKKLAFLTHPSNATVGSLVTPVVKVAVQDSNGNSIASSLNPVTITLKPVNGTGSLIGTLTENVSSGEATFSNLEIAGSGGTYELVAASPGLVAATSSSFTVLPVPTAVINPPVVNACQSSYDQFYGSEPGVYAFWALCEGGIAPAIRDYIGPFDLLFSGGNWGGTWGAGTLAGGVPGPVSDGETAVQVPTASAFIESQGIPLNTNQGTISAWVNASASPYPVSAVFLGAVNGASLASLTVNKDTQSTNGSVCFSGVFRASSAGPYSATKCGFSPNAWHRVTTTWNSGTLHLFVDGALKTSTTYAGSLDNKLFYFRLFPGCCNTGNQMTLAKVLVANQAWTAAQAFTDYSPTLLSVATGGLHVTSELMGTIHRDVLGYMDNNSDLSTSTLTTPLLSGLRSAGLTALRYASGYGGSAADLSNWQGGDSCTRATGVLASPQNDTTNNNLDTYLTKIAHPLGLHIGFTVNYGTNPPLCNSGGDPVINGANLVDYANNAKHYGIKYWEIGNEVYSYQTETDLHANPHSAASYIPSETAFYNAMKARDASILIGVPIGESAFDYQTNFDLPVLASAKYDDIVWHNYPVVDPITDGDMLYQDRVASTLHRSRGSLLRLQTELLNVGKSPDSIWVTEWDGDVGGNEWSHQAMGAVMPLYATVQLAEYMRAGVQYATWLAQGMSNSCYQYYYDWTGENTYNWWDCGGSSLVYTGNLPGELRVGFKAGDLTPAARAFQLLSQSGFVTEGEHMLNTQSDVQNTPWLMSYAATHGSSYGIILINRDRDNAHSVPVTFEHKAFGSSVIQWTYGRAQYDQSYFGNWGVAPVRTKLGAWSGTFHAALPPLSVNIFIF